MELGYFFCRGRKKLENIRKIVRKIFFSAYNPTIIFVALFMHRILRTLKCLLIESRTIDYLSIILDFVNVAFFEALKNTNTPFDLKTPPVINYNLL